MSAVQAAKQADQKVLLTLDDRRHIALQALRAQTNPIDPFQKVEGVEDAIFRARKVDGTPFECITTAFREQGLDVDGTNGAVMVLLDLNQDQVHNALCECIHGPMAGRDAAEYLALEF